ncbi:unnamed protein product [Fraxinus pennsylvanica]|uniref:Uncharacterized protein n=1 Tax=Fraxinus pennsylvanica TaxID=56036 RepID=A0AAD2A0Q7_9LAMI|nr:unnamed protein product [Fraxinus pennsylvanica]
MPPVVDSDESMNVSDPLRSENRTPNEVASLNLYVVIHISDSGTLDRPERRQLQPPFQSIRLPSFISEHLQRKVVPVGPRFQADVHKWNGPVEKSLLIGVFKNDFWDSRWLGTKVWPIEVGTVKTRGRMNEKGRPGPCRCVTPGSVDCIRRHILERRQLLQRDLGHAFFGWKFYEMGEQCLSMQTRSPLKQVDSDDDEVEDFNSMGLQKRCKGKKAIKTRYLHVAS